MAKAKKLSPDLIKRFANDLEFYSKTCLQLRTKEATIDYMVFNESQRIVHEKLKKQYEETGRVRAIVLKARQMGVSTYTAARFFRRLHLFPNQEALVLADQLDRAKKLFSIYDRFAHLLPPEVAPMVRYTSKQTQLVLDNPDDKARSTSPGLSSSITVETAKDSAAGRASTINLMHLSEMAFWDNATDVWISLAQAVPDVGSEVVVESTANGVGNFFHQMWLSAEEGRNGYIPIFLPWWIHEEYRVKLSREEADYVRESLDEVELGYVEQGILFEGTRHKLSLEQVAWRRQTIRDKLLNDEYAFRQEYPANAEEAFLVSGNCFFDEDILAWYHKEAEAPKRRVNLVKKGAAIIAKDARAGYLRIWETPKATGTYLLAADTASGRQVSARDTSFSDPDNEQGGRDFSCADVYDVHARKQVAQLHGRMAPEVFAQQLDLLGKYYSSASQAGAKAPSLIVVERNHSSGETVLRLLDSEHHYPNLYYNRRINTRAGKRVEDRLGFVTSVETRQPMLDYLAAAIREKALVIPNVDTIKEMTTFVRGEDGKPSGQEGTHDDRVIALAIAVFVASQRSWTPPKHANELELANAGSSATGLFDY